MWSLCVLLLIYIRYQESWHANMADERPKRQRTVRSCTVSCLKERVKSMREEFVVESSRGKSLLNVFQNNDLKVT